MKRLLLLRHAKAEQAKKDTPEDRERALTERGRTDAPRIGAFMRSRGYVPDRILCSPSRRTRETLELAGLPAKVPAEFPEELYLAGTKRVIALLRQVPETVNHLLVIGHNPGLEDTAIALIGDLDKTSPFARFDKLTEKFPTCALAVLDLRIARWTDLELHSAALADFVRPKDLSES